MSGFLVRTYCATYNHEAYIIDALRGFVMQETSFPVVYTIVDDASTDKTAEVLRQFVNDHFVVSLLDGGYDKDTDFGHVTFARHKTNTNCYFAVIYLKENHYSQKKSKAPYLSEWMDTKYIALCEGDDYWIDPMKLQKQVDVLEADDTLMAVVTNSRVVDKNGRIMEEKVRVVPDNHEGRYDLRGFMNNRHLYPTATVCYRRSHTEEIDKMQKTMANPYFGDWSFWIILHVFGNFYYLDQVTSSYRMNPTSVTHTYDRVGRSKENWKINEALLKILPMEYEDLRKGLDDKTWMWIDLGFAYRHERKYIRMLWCFFVAFLKNPGEVRDDFTRRMKLKKK